MNTMSTGKRRDFDFRRKTMPKVPSILFSAAFLVMSAASLFGDVDPALFQDGTGCAGGYWCAGTGEAVDPNTGDRTLEFLINTPTPGTVSGITTPFGTGWLADKTGSTVDFLLDFEIVGGQDAIFLYCGYTQCTVDDIGLPTNMPTYAASFAYGTIFTPTAGQPGYGVAYTPNSDATPQYGIAQGLNSNLTFINGVGVRDVPVPEPSAALQLACMMIALAAFARRKFSRNT